MVNLKLINLTQHLFIISLSTNNEMLYNLFIKPFLKLINIRCHYKKN